MWHYLLALPFVPAFVGGVVFLVFFPESPKALLINGFPQAAKKCITKISFGLKMQVWTLLMLQRTKGLQLLRHNEDVDAELEEMRRETYAVKEETGGDGEQSTSVSKNVSMCGLFCKRELRWPMITSLCVQITQQLCGINAVFFYSSSIFAAARIPSDYIQYAIVATGFVNVLATVACMPLIDRLGRKPLLVYPMLLMIVDFGLLTYFLNVIKLLF